MILVLEGRGRAVYQALCLNYLPSPFCFQYSEGRSGSKAEGRFGLSASPPGCCAVTCCHDHALPSSPPAAFLAFCLELPCFLAMAFEFLFKFYSPILDTKGVTNDLCSSPARRGGLKQSTSPVGKYNKKRDSPEQKLRSCRLQSKVTRYSDIVQVFNGIPLPK